jgi:hypothetical protein
VNCPMIDSLQSLHCIRFTSKCSAEVFRYCHVRAPGTQEQKCKCAPVHTALSSSHVSLTPHTMLAVLVNSTHSVNVLSLEQGKLCLHCSAQSDWLAPAKCDERTCSRVDAENQGTWKSVLKTSSHWAGCQFCYARKRTVSE